MKLVALPALTDNYIWLLHDGEQALVVDPGEPQPVRTALNELGLRLAAILVTHHHADHTGGVAALAKETSAAVHLPAHERIPIDGHRHAEGATVAILGLPWQVLEVPGHTRGHIAWYGAEVGGTPLLFCGDTLFSAGCGRLFEGTAQQMHASVSRLAALPEPTRVCCAHEYTLSNLAFARAVEPHNLERDRYEALCRHRRAQGEPTLPSSIGLERAVNPFLRCGEVAVRDAVIRHAGLPADADQVTLFAALRRWKDEFR